MAIDFNVIILVQIFCLNHAPLKKKFLTLSLITSLCNLQPLILYVGLPELCLACECTEISGTTTCNRTDRKVGGCPSGCSSSCPCTRSIPPICWCTYEVETCSSERCPESTAANKRENLLTLKRNY